jgi:hypothetical protein
MIVLRLSLENYSDLALRIAITCKVRNSLS